MYEYTCAIRLDVIFGAPLRTCRKFSNDCLINRDVPLRAADKSILAQPSLRDCPVSKSGIGWQARRQARCARGLPLRHATLVCSLVREGAPTLRSGGTRFHRSIPDFIPILGDVNDVILLPIGICAVVKLIPPDIMAEHRHYRVACRLPPHESTSRRSHRFALDRLDRPDGVAPLPLLPRSL